MFLVKFFNFINWSFFKKISTSFFVINSGNFLNFLAMIILGKKLSLISFGSFNSYFNFISIFTFPCLLIQTYILKSYLSEKSLTTLANVFSMMLINLTIFSFFFIIFKDFIFIDLDFEIIKNFYAYTFLIILFSYLNTSLLSIILRLDFYNRFNFQSQIFFIFKILIILILIYSDKLDLNNSILMYVMSLGLCLFFVIFFNFSILKNEFLKLRPISFSKIKIFQLNDLVSLKSILIIQFIFTIFINTDVLICRKYCSIEESNGFASISVYSKILFFLMTSVIAVFFSIITKKENGLNSIKYLKQMYFYSIPIIFLFNSIIFLFPKLILDILLNENYYFMIDEVIVLNFSMSILIIANYNYQYLLSKKFHNYIFEIISIFVFLSITILFNYGSALIISFYFLAFSISIICLSFFKIGIANNFNKKNI